MYSQFCQIQNKTTHEVSFHVYECIFKSNSFIQLSQKNTKP